jgi:hypothetical protein
VEPSEKAGSTQDVTLVYVERSKAYVYSTMRVPHIYRKPVISSTLAKKICGLVS